MVKTGKMLVRAGFLLAVILGLGMMFGWLGPSMLQWHMLAGVLAVVGALLVAIGGRSSMRWPAVALLVLGAALAIAKPFDAAGKVHFVAMLLGVILLERGGKG